MTLIVAALALGASDGVRGTAKQAIGDAYSAMKNLVINRYASVSADVEGLEQEPEEELRRALVEKKLTQVRAGDDVELYGLAQALLSAVEEQAPDLPAAIGLVNALSQWLELTVWRNDREYRARFEFGECTVHVHDVGPATGQRGTEVRFLASAKTNREDGTFSNLEYQFKTLETRLREQAFLNSGVKIILEDERHAEPQKTELFYEGGVREFVRYLDRSKQAVMADPIYMVGDRGGIGVEVAMWWNDSYHETVLRFTNNIPQRDGGTHMAGFRVALTRTITKYAQDSGIAKREKVDFTGDDAREGLTCVLSVKVPDPKFSSQTKDKLVSSEVRPAVENLVNEKLSEWFEEKAARAPIR